MALQADACRVHHAGGDGERLARMSTRGDVYASQVSELPLAFLSPDAVAEYLRTRFPGLPEPLCRAVHRRTQGEQVDRHQAGGLTLDAMHAHLTASQR